MQNISDTIDIENMIIKQLDEFSDVPPNYQPKIAIFQACPVRIEDEERLTKHINAGLKRCGYPSYYAYFYGVGYRPVKNIEELLKCFYTFLAFTVVDPARRGTCKRFFYSDKEYKDGPYVSLYIGCIEELNKIARSILSFAFRKQTRNMENMEIIARFFQGDFFKIVGKDELITTKCSDDNRKYLLKETAQCFFQITKHPELLIRTYKLCCELLDRVNDLIYFDKRLQEENQKEGYSKGGSKRYSKYDDIISNEQKETIFQKFVKEYPDAVENYKLGKRGIVQNLSNCFDDELKKQKNISETSISTTRKWATTLLKKHCNE